MSLPDPATIDEAPARPPRRRLTNRLSAGHLVMIVAGLAALVLNYGLLRARSETVPVAVSARELRPGVPVDASAFRFTEVRVEDPVLEGLIRPEDLEAVAGWIVADHLPAGELVSRSDLRPPSAPTELRAMSVPVERAHAAGGDIRPGDRVDVIHVRDGRAFYVIEAAPVLAVHDSGTGALAGMGSFSITVGVDADQALRLALAISEGSLEVVRSTGAPSPEVAEYAPEPPATTETTPPEPGGG